MPPLACFCLSQCLDLTSKLIFFTALFCAFASSSGSDNIQCAPINVSYEHFLGSATPYRLVANKNSSRLDYKGCHPVKIWSLVRHGTRNPSAKIIVRMTGRLAEVRDLILKNLPQATEHIHNTHLDMFRLWSPKLVAGDAEKLTHEGEDEMVFLAERMQSRFPDLLQDKYSTSSYKFKFTATQRTKKSAQYFASGLFGRTTVKDVEFQDPLKKDPILRFYKLCKKWQSEVKKNEKALSERVMFQGSDVMDRTVQEVNQRLGFKVDKLDFEDIHTMYTTCAFETAWNKRKKSPWCSPFTLDNLKALEYYEDLKYYWIDGYGYNVTYKQACPAFNDMLEFLTDVETLPRAVVYFTHSGTLLKMLAHLDLYKDRMALKASDFEKNGDRQWRVSKIDSFGTNLAFVLYRCDDQIDRILTMHQEHIVRLPSCRGADLCEVEAVKKFYSESTDNCQFDTMCDNATQ